MGTPVRIGEVIKGKYRIERVLGEGGMGVVVAAHHLALDQPVAIKFLLGSMLAHPAIVERFAREARAASKLHSDHVARVTDVDSLDAGVPFMVMEYLEGSDLSFVRKEGKVLPVGRAVGFILQACDAIGEAHRLGIVHRDLKPANLFLAKRPDGKTRIKVLDFGISKMDDAGGLADAKVTKTSSVMGSAEYMSPEQMLSTRDVDSRTDIWALGVTLFELLTRRVPYPGETVTQVYACMMSKLDTPQASAAREDIPPELDGVIAKCLAKEREDRYASIAELVDALQPFEASQESTPGERAKSQGKVPAVVVPTTLRSKSQGAASPITGDEATQTDEATANDVEARSRSESGTRVAGGSTTGVVSSDPVPQPPKVRGLRWILLAAAIALPGLAYLAWPKPSVTAGLPAASSSGSAPSPADGMVRVRIRVKPESAKLFLDATLLPVVNGAFDHTMLRSDIPQLLRAEAPGYKAINKPVAFSADVEMTIDLEREDVPTPVQKDPVQTEPKAQGRSPSKATTPPAATAKPAQAAPYTPTMH